LIKHQGLLFWATVYSVYLTVIDEFEYAQRVS